MSRRLSPRAMIPLMPVKGISSLYSADLMNAEKGLLRMPRKRLYWKLQR